ncbi:MAG: signal peptidase II [Proteobacteria bacterium]|jgi:signal peptidase II|nr:signal peptidase II [Pseudomonadota bacterium]
MAKKYWILAGLSGFIVSLDQLTKMWIHTTYQLGESTPVIAGFFNITYVRNFGAAFGFLSESHPTFREIFFLTMPPIALIIILMILRSVADNDKWNIIALSSVFGGAIGNYIDRLRFRYVIDFLDFHIKEKYSWPAFNIADMAIVSGVILLLILMFLEEKAKKDHPANAA